MDNSESWINIESTCSEFAGLNGSKIFAEILNPSQDFIIFLTRPSSTLTKSSYLDCSYINFLMDNNHATHSIQKICCLCSWISLCELFSFFWSMEAMVGVKSTADLHKKEKLPWVARRRVARISKWGGFFGSLILKQLEKCKFSAVLNQIEADFLSKVKWS